MATEKRLIDANALIEEMKDCAITRQDLYCNGYAQTFIENAPTVDAVEVVHAKWENIRNFDGGECYGWCSHCKTPVKADNATGLVMSNRFCHWCGAKMDGE